MIKFRAWDKEEKEMIEVLEISFRFKTIEFVKLYDQIPYAFSKHFSEIELMQSTGTRYIYDEKGKEIFEGDIVKTRASEYGRFIGYVDNAISHFKVRGVKQYKGLSVDLDGTCEIIGNIYENPELLEDE